MFLLAAVSAFAKNDWKGKVLDKKGEPVPYANVAVPGAGSDEKARM